MTHADDNRQRYQDLRQKYQSMETDTLILLWEKDSHQDWSKALLKSELISRGFSSIKLEDTRAQRKPVSGVSASALHKQPIHMPTPKSVGASQFAASALVFIVVFGVQTHIAYQFVPAIPTGKQFDDFMLISMGMAFLPIIFIMLVGMVVIMLMGLIAFLLSRLCWKFLGRNT
jgi:hypothetical protein